MQKNRFPNEHRPVVTALADVEQRLKQAQIQINVRMTYLNEISIYRSAPFMFRGPLETGPALQSADTQTQ
jgi:hypothetical protein